MNFIYIALITSSLGCILLADHKYKLAFWNDRKATCRTIIILMIIFLIWDLLGISLGIFFSGNSQYMSGIYLLPELPIEEIFFLFLLSYLPIIMFSFLESR